MNRDVLVLLLRSVGFDVREAVDGQEAIAVWEEWEPHLIWMDMRMPVMNGYEATRHIKASTKGQATVIIALTASAFEEERTVVLSAGCDDFVRKPFREAEVFDKMADYLGVRYTYDVVATDMVRAYSGGVSLEVDSLRALPLEWRKALHQAARSSREVQQNVIGGLARL